ncbi:MAG TPA: TIGR00153 family protein [Candidatus Thermoplasmatota archaeon]|nr:TIGR00153 family protein [Candidatus Thermoplasmatota archaeon]
MSPHRDKEPEVPHTSPLDRILRRESPFDPLFKHASKVAECVRLLEQGFTQYAEGRYTEFSATARRIGEVEHEADILKSTVSAHLPRGLFMSVDRGRFELLLHDQDSILDDVEDLAERMDARPTPIPAALRPAFQDLVQRVIATVDAYEKAVEMFADVLETGFGGAARDEVKAHVKTVHLREFEADRSRFALLRALTAVENDLKPLDVVHLTLFADLLDNVADHAEASADRLRAMIAQ